MRQPLVILGERITFTPNLIAEPDLGCLHGRQVFPRSVSDFFRPFRNRNLRVKCMTGVLLLVGQALTYLLFTLYKRDNVGDQLLGMAYLPIVDLPCHFEHLHRSPRKLPVGARDSLCKFEPKKCRMVKKACSSES